MSKDDNLNNQNNNFDTSANNPLQEGNSQMVQNSTKSTESAVVNNNIKSSQENALKAAPPEKFLPLIHEIESILNEITNIAEAAEHNR